ncbi:MAG: hypothetical protein KF847_11970 [Pirellulales bacterium]|nr:hypothetical protein [Pirellulales bacterium]
MTRAVKVAWLFAALAPVLLAGAAQAADDGGSDHGLGTPSYHLSRLEQFDGPQAMWLTVATVGGLLAALAAWQYRREHVSLPGLTAWALAGLRIVAVLGAIVFFLAPVKRTDRRVTTESRVEILVDASQSMTIADEPAGGDNRSRAAAAAALLADSPLVNQLRRQHDVQVRTFDAQTLRVATWPRQTEADDATPSTPSAPQPTDDAATSTAEPGAAKWTETLQPSGAATRLGDSLAAVFDDSAAGPLAGVLVVTDGVQNGGLDPLAAADRAAAANVPLFTAGVGSTEPRRNARLQELVAPARAYPDDEVTIRALVSAEGLRGRRFNVELTARARQGDASAAAMRVGVEPVEVTEDLQEAQVEFSFTPAEAGALELEARIEAPPEDAYAADDRATAEMVVVETSSRVLLIAGSATRDYRFLRNQLFRDRHATVDVLLQSAPAGISQESNRILTDFPAEREQLFEYDCIAAFDPDWTQLDAAQIDLLEEWVADEAGGLIVVAGPVHTAAWVQGAEQAKIRSLYPVEFQRRLTLMDDGAYGSRTPWPLDFTRAGEEAAFLRLADTPDASRRSWDEFPGVYGCYAVKGPKPAATVYARYSDPDASITAELPAYFVEHFYGSGRVFYMGSGEMWRLRSVDPKYFEVLYTQLVRHVSQGRLLRGSSRGRLLVERDRYDVGEPVVLRAQLTTASREPYVAERVRARVTGPDGAGRNVELAADPQRAGTFVGQFTPTSEGSYRIELPVPDALDEQLSRRVQASAPDLEFRQTRRDEKLLAALAERTGGQYYAEAMTAATGGEGTPAVATLIPSRAETKTVRGKPDSAFTELLNKTLLGVICGALLLEWLLRRLYRLA